MLCFCFFFFFGGGGEGGEDRTGYQSVSLSNVLLKTTCFPLVFVVVVDAAAVAVAFFGCSEHSLFNFSAAIFLLLLLFKLLFRCVRC